MFYRQLNLFIDQLERNLDSEIDYQALAKQQNLNLATLQKVFPLITGLTIVDYVRRRRLTLAGKDLAQSDFRIIDIALKYGYTSAVAFSRAFYRFHHVMPHDVKQSVRQLNYYPRLHLAAPAPTQDLTYAIIQMDALDLRGLEIFSDYQHIRTDAPALFANIKEHYSALPHPDFGVLNYELGREVDESYHYYALWRSGEDRQLTADHYPEFVSFTVPAMRYLKFTVPSQEAIDIQAASTNFYDQFLPTCEYQLRPEPDLEYYHDGVTDLLIPIY